MPHPPSSKDVAAPRDTENSAALSGEAPAVAHDAKNAVAAYLRSLKRSRSAPAHSAQPTAPSSIPGGVERRRAVRYKCEGSAEFRVEGSDVRTWGALNDISLNGCYIEAAAAPPVGTLLYMVLEVNRIRVHLQGEVRVSYPFTGIGVAYREISEEEREKVRELLRSLSESQGAKAGVPSNAAQPAPATPAITDPESAVNAVVKFFQARSMLSRQDFWELIRKSQSRT
jgi:PilZ domain-containing protein